MYSFQKMNTAVFYGKGNKKSAELALPCDESEDELAFSDGDEMNEGSEGESSEGESSVSEESLDSELEESLESEAEMTGMILWIVVKNNVCPCVYVFVYVCDRF